MALYLKMDGAQGAVTDKGFECQIELQDVEFAGVCNSVQMQVGQKLDRFNTKPKFGQVAILKYLDASSQVFFEAVHSGKVIPSLDISTVQTGDPSFLISKLTLKNVAVTHFSDKQSDGSGKPLEMIGISYTQMQRTYVPRGSDGTAGSQSVSGFDVEAATKL